MAVPSIERPTKKKWLLVVCRCTGVTRLDTRSRRSRFWWCQLPRAGKGSQPPPEKHLDPFFFARQVDSPCNCHLSKSLPDHCILVKGRRCRSEVSCPARKNRNRDANLTKYVFRNALLRTTYSSTADEWQSKMLCAGSTAIPNIAGIP